MITVRPEQHGDHEAVRDVNRRAFAGGGEAALVDALRGKPGTVSLVALWGSSIVGHIFFSPVQIEGPGGRARAAGLGPMAVTPDYQRRGIGSRLVVAGVEDCRQLGYEAIVVLGHAAFYPQFGFARASRWGLQYEQSVADEVFMALELAPGVLAGGVVRYSPEFKNV